MLAQESIAANPLTTAGSPFARYSQSLLAKVRASLPAILREKLDVLATILGSATVPAKDFTPYSGTIDCLTKAAVEQRRVILNYYTLARAATTERKVEPYCIYFDPDGATLKVVGFDHHRGRIVPFAIDHIRSIKETDETFERPVDFNLRDYLTANCFNGIHGDPVTVRLRAYGVTERIFAERTFHPSQRTLECADSSALSKAATSRRPPEETTTIEMRVASGRGLVRFILGWAPDVEVLSPPELRDEVANAHLRALSIYSISSD